MTQDNNTTSPLQNLMLRRRSCRHFTSVPLTPEQAEVLMQAALLAPSGRGRHSTHYILCDDPEVLRHLSSVRGDGSKFISEAPLAVVLFGSALHSSTYIEDAAIAASYIQLQATDLGLSSCWCQISGQETPDGQDANERVRQLLEIPYLYDVVCIIAIGHPKEDVSPHDLTALPWERMHLQRFDDTRISDL